MEIIIDTNFILTCVKQKIDLFSDFDEIFGVYTLIIPEQVIDELKLLKTKKNLTVKEKNSVELAIDLLNLKKVKIVNMKTKNVDAGIIKYLNNQNNKCVLATLDKDLIKKITNKKILFLTIKDKRRVVLV
ncbi:MAG TPA: hypothetical protein P5277_01980 [Candidatus Paceibacterota bacterium]|nr:hypothetical protein [Candidatus Paceibacterota bacterium]